MYKITNYQTKEIIEMSETITWIRMQDDGIEVLCPECTYETADGVMLSDHDTILGIEGRNMQEFTPTVTVSVMPETELQIRIMGGALEDVVNQVASINTKVNTLYDAQTSGTIALSTLDKAYKEGVNSYAE